MATKSTKYYFTIERPGGGTYTTGTQAKTREEAYKSIKSEVGRNGGKIVGDYGVGTPTTKRFVGADGANIKQSGYDIALTDGGTDKMDSSGIRAEHGKLTPVQSFPTQQADVPDNGTDTYTPPSYTPPPSQATGQVDVPQQQPQPIPQQKAQPALQGSVQPAPIYSGGSIVDFLNQSGQKSDLASRRQLAGVWAVAVAVVRLPVRSLGSGVGCKTAVCTSPSAWGM